MCKYELRTLRLSKVIVNRQTDGHNRNYITVPRCLAVGQQLAFIVYMYMYMQIMTSVRYPRPRPQLNVSLRPRLCPRTFNNLADATRLYPHNVSFIIGMYRFKRLIV